MYANPQMPPPRSPRRSNGPLYFVLAAIGAVVLLFGGCTAVVAMAGGSGQEPAKPVAADPSASTPKPTRHPKLKVPDVVGMNAQDAYDKLDKLGFTNINTGSDDGSVPMLLTNWNVKSQSVPAGKKISRGRSITLTLTRPGDPSDDGEASVGDGDTVTFTVTGSAPSGVDITYGDDASNLNGDGLPFTTTMKVKDDALYYAVTAQLNGGGHIHCKVTIGDKTKSGEAKGGYNICSAQLNSGVFGGWD